MIQKLRTDSARFHWTYVLADEPQVDKFYLYRVSPGSTTPMAIQTSQANFRELYTGLGYSDLGVYRFYLTAKGTNGMESDASNTVEIELVDSIIPPPPPPPPLPGQKPPAPTNFWVE